MALGPPPGHFLTSRHVHSSPLCGLAGKTRTRDKYRVVYTEHQRLELEKEFFSAKYITIRRKSELAAGLGLSERQVSIVVNHVHALRR